MKEFLLYDIPIEHLLAATIGLAALTVTFYTLLKKYFKLSRRKAIESKLLLRELLENFGLEVPPELKNPEQSVVKSIKIQ